MADSTGQFGSLPAAVADVIRQAGAGSPGAVSDAGATQAYGHVAGQVTPEEFQQVATESYARMSPDQRSQVADYLRTQAAQSGMSVPAIPSAATAASNPGALADASAQIHAQGPNMLQELFAPGGTFSNPIAKMALVGITALAAQRISRR